MYAFDLPGALDSEIAAAAWVPTLMLKQNDNGHIHNITLSTGCICEQCGDAVLVLISSAAAGPKDISYP